VFFLQAQEWLVIDSEGEHLAKGTAPEGFRLLQVRGDSLIGVQVDALGFESIATYQWLWQEEP
jgi:hypothetical protein